MPKANYEAPQEVEKPYEAPQPPVNFERLHGAAVEEIHRLQTVLETYQGDAKVVGIVPSQLGFIALDDRGRLFERVNDPSPRGPGPQGKMWVRIDGPRA